jgi:hypothetical protein
MLWLQQTTLHIQSPKIGEQSVGLEPPLELAEANLLSNRRKSRLIRAAQRRQRTN